MKKIISYGKQWIDRDDIKAVAHVLKSDFLTQGPKVTEFEEKICKYTGAKYCVAVSNGTAALHLAVKALGIREQAEAITSPITFVASSNAMIYNGLKPVFADIDPRFFNIDPNEIASRITKKTKLIIPVHYAGQPCQMRQIAKIAKQHRCFVIEDGAHAIGSSYQDGTKVGNCKYSDLTTFSFHPVKTITTGEGGAITTNDKELYEKLLVLRTHGITKDPKSLSKNPGPWYYEMQDLGFNYRLTDLQAALGTSQLKKLDKFASRRREIVKKYNQAFKNLAGVMTPYEDPKVNSAFHLYTLQIDFAAVGQSRVQLMQKLKDQGIGSQVLYIPVHLQPYYRKNYKYRAGDYKRAEAFYEQALSLPLFPKMTNRDVRSVIKALKEALNG